VLVAAQALLLAKPFLPWRATAISVAVLATVALPLETVYAFDRLFAVNGTNGLPITLDQGVVFSWVDRNVGPTGRVTVMKYPVGGPDWWAGQGYWWDVEFWNESAVEMMADMSLKKEPHWRTHFDPQTGAALNAPETPFALFYGADVRFRLAGRQVIYERDAYIFETERPWRATWLTDGIYADGWTRPHRPATITVFPEPGQKTPLRRFLTIAVASPDPLEPRPVTVSSNLGRKTLSIPPNKSVDHLLQLCVPPDGTGQVTVATPTVSAVYRDPTKSALSGHVDRPVGVLLRIIALADEREPMERCPT